MTSNGKRVAVVTGGIGGLGTEICVHLANAGHTVVAVDLAASNERIEPFKQATRQFNGQVNYRPINVADHAETLSVMRQIESEFGTVDVLVNAAGITRDASFRKMSPEQWTDVIHINLTGAYNVTRAVIDGMVDRGFGRIVNISSVNGQTGNFGQTNYSAAKAGLHGFTMALAREVARKGVTVNSISPGYCDTPMVRAIPGEIREKIISQIPVGRIGLPVDIARAVVFLSEEGASFITGANIPVNGGMFMDF